MRAEGARARRPHIGAPSTLVKTDPARNHLSSYRGGYGQIESLMGRPSCGPPTRQNRGIPWHQRCNHYETRTCNGPYRTFKVRNYTELLGD
ncbi:hypothetical protein PGT21_035298 [Puccinia graminis f. sp. tritici]|uniref:Uncharacterized protein n=1 Tax=Puccinia graminis f. sp. tritici TaxID=56615 RepID=A0A5B0NGF2_PUCGR|nr:hypothetical protein PGT21_035298 [Puccinia graminis f. sp. tritici]